MIKIENKRCELFLREGTEKNPNDGFYYLFHKNKLTNKYNSLQKAQEAFDKIEKQYPALPLDNSPAKLGDMIKNLYRTVSNDALLGGKRRPFKNPK